MRQKLAIAAAFAGLIIAGLPFVSRAAAPGQVRAGVGVIDATWHVGASAGQYASDGTSVGEHGMDPFTHTTRRAPSYGVQSRNSVRVIVVEGSDGTRVALMKNDLYIPQDLLNERIATILEEYDAAHPDAATRINHANLMVAVSHSHSSPYYSSPSWGLWAFQDVFDLRFFEYMAQRSAQAVIQAVSRMVPVRMGATTVPYDHAQRHSFGPAVADDGTPAGYPNSDNDKTISILRFDDISAPPYAKPLAIFMTLGLHPEMLEGNNLITGEYVGAVERMVNAQTGATLIFAQNNTGTSEPARNCNPNGCAVRAEYSHREYAQAARAARTISDAVLSGWKQIGAGSGTIKFQKNFPVKMIDRQFAPPVSHPYPSVSNCRTHEAFEGNPGIPIAGLPDCERFTGGALKPVFDQLGPLDPGVTYDKLRKAGVPLPENYSAPSYAGLQETFQVHLQAIRLGPVLLTVCPCEQWADQSRNIKTRADQVQGNMWIGYDWGASCTDNENATWSCPHPSGTRVITDRQYRVMRAQVNNDAAGWDALDPESIARAEAEEYEPEDIKGNYTHEELSASRGYPMVVTVGMANDYWGYIATYREYSRGDHYRKALTGLGPHASDFLATRLVRMGGYLKGGPAVEYNALDLAYMVDGAHQHARAQVIGRDAQVLLAAYEALLPPDGGRARAVAQPSDIQRFDVSSFSWIGGSNYTDDPKVQLQKLVGGKWIVAGDQSGDVVVTLDYPEVEDTAQLATGSHEWRWTAHFEAFDSDIDTGRGRQTAAGTYRFVVKGTRRILGGTAPYRVASGSFQITPWEGVTVDDLQAGPNGASFLVGPVNTKTFTTGYPGGGSTVTATVGPIDYPDGWPTAKYPASPETGDVLFPRLQRTAVVDGQDTYLYCFPCTYGPWSDTGSVDRARLLIERVNGAIEVVTASLQGGRWTANVSLSAGDCVTVRRGDVVDTFGEFNGSPSNTVCV